MRTPKLHPENLDYLFVMRELTGIGVRLRKPRKHLLRKSSKN